jgi:tryptophanyl-tRNA synthetase
MSDSERKPVLLSGIQPSGNLMIGNLIGALRSWAELQDRYDCLFVVVDLHAITVPQEPAELRRRCLDFLCLYLACGIDPVKSTVFVQSHVPAHSELAWLLGCHTYMGELSRMTQFKDKSKKQGENIRSGLFFYPVLMAADILLYGADLVPVGDDQRQHLEITRDIAQRFNQLHGDVFTVPEAYFPKVGARIMSLTDPTSKMSKSDENPRSYVALLDAPDVIRGKIRRAVTDSGTEVRFAPESQPAISNLLQIHAALSGESIPSLESRFTGKGYADFKEEVAEVVVQAVAPIQERYRQLRTDKAGLEAILGEGAARAERRARRILDKVKRKVGFIPRT